MEDLIVKSAGRVSDIIKGYLLTNINTMERVKKDMVFEASK